MAVSERAFLVLDLVFIWRVWRKPNPEVMTTSRFQYLHRRHGEPPSDLTVEGPADHVALLFRRQPDEIHGVARKPDRELRIFVRAFHGVLERLLVDNVEVHVEAAAVEIDVEGLDRFINQLVLGQMRLLRSYRNRVADAIERILVRKFRDR